MLSSAWPPKLCAYRPVMIQKISCSCWCLWQVQQSCTAWHIDINMFWIPFPLFSMQFFPQMVELYSNKYGVILTLACISTTWLHLSHADSQRCIDAARSIAPRCRLPHYTPQTFAVEWQVRRPRQRDCFEGELVWLPCCHIFLKCWKSTAIRLSSFVTYVWANNATFGKPVIAVLSFLAADPDVFLSS